MVRTIGAEYNLEYWQLVYNTPFLNTDVEGGVYVKMAPGYKEFDKKGSSNTNEASKEPLRPSPEPIELMGDDRRTSGGDNFQNLQVGPVTLHLLESRRHHYFYHIHDVSLSEID